MTAETTTAPITYSPVWLFAPVASVEGSVDFLSDFATVTTPAKLGLGGPNGRIAGLQSLIDPDPASARNVPRLNLS
jgi:hypothetical protein